MPARSRSTNKPSSTASSLPAASRQTCPPSARRSSCSEDQVLPHLAGLSNLLAGDGPPDRARRAGITGPAWTADLIDQLRATGTVLTYNPRDRTLRADGHDAVSVTIGKSR